MIENKQEYENFAAKIINEAKQVMFGVDNVLRLCLVALYTEGHVLLEGNPGLGKTELVKTLSQTLSLPFNRIQFTPDLMPSDITGTLMPDPGNMENLDFKPGPVFTALLLADEINRATPKTQAAMLEAMAERQVTVLGEEHQLAQQDFKWFLHENGKMIAYPKPPGKRPERPFIVLATQNPIDHEGTFDLPEAQSDRFMFKILMPVPSSKTLNEILTKTTTNLKKSDSDKKINLDSYHLSVQSYERIRKKIKGVGIGIAARAHVLNLFLATNNRFNQIDSIDSNAEKELKDLIGQLNYGLGPRAATALILGAQAWRLFFTSDTSEADGHDLAHVIVPALRHRIRLKYGWESAFQKDNSDKSTVDKDRLVDEYLYKLCDAAAPTKLKVGRGYKKVFSDALRTSIDKLTY